MYLTLLLQYIDSRFYLLILDSYILSLEFSGSFGEETRAALLPLNSGKRLAKNYAETMIENAKK